MNPIQPDEFDLVNDRAMDRFERLVEQNPNALLPNQLRNMAAQIADRLENQYIQFGADPMGARMRVAIFHDAAMHAIDDMIDPRLAIRAASAA